MKINIQVPLILLIILSLGLAGCSMRKLMVDEFVGVVATGLPALEQGDDLHLQAQAMPAHIKLLETLLASDPGNADLLVLLARLYGGYAFAVLETEAEALRFDQPSVVGVNMPPQKLEGAATRYFKIGKTYALQALEGRYADAGDQLQRVDSAQAFFKSLKKEDVPALFWYGFNLGAYVHHSLDSVSAMAKAPLVEKAMQRVLELDPIYYYGNAHLVLVVYFASRSTMMGGNPRQARIHFDRHRELMPQVSRLRELYWARYYLVQTQAREEFVRRLTKLAREPGPDESIGLLDRVAILRARIYLGAVNELFE